MNKLTLAVCALSVLLLGGLYSKRVSQTSTKIRQNIEYSVKTIEVMDDCSLLLGLETGQKIYCRFPVNVVPNAKISLIRFLNKSTNPKVVLIEAKGDYYVADLRVIPLGSVIDVSVSQWLKDRELVWVNPV